MGKDFLVILACGIYIVLLVLVGIAAKRHWGWKSELVRKFIHIMVANLMFPILYLMETPWLRLVGPALFMVVNYAALSIGIGKYLGMESHKRDNGLVLYPFSVLLLTFGVNQGVLAPENALCGVFLMGWGDGFAALVGTRWGRHTYRMYGKYTKSVEGSLAMVLAGMLAVLLFSDHRLIFALGAALFATVVENLSPSGVDNVSVPILSAVFMEVLCTL